MSETDKTEYVTTTVEPDLKRVMRIEAGRRGVSMSKVMRETLSDRFGDVEVPEEALVDD